MTVSNQKNKVQYVGDGSTTAFTIPFPFLDNGHIVVISTNLATQVDTVKTITTHYTLSGQGTQSGTCTFGSAPTASERITIYRATPINQLLDLKENDVFSAGFGEDAIDKLTMILIDLKEIADRGVAIEITSTGATPTTDSFASVTDVFVAEITGPPVNGAHPFTEQEPIASTTNWQNLSGGRTGSGFAFNGCNDTLTGKKVLFTQHIDAGGATAYRFNPPVACSL